MLTFFLSALEMLKSIKLFSLCRLESVHEAVGDPRPPGPGVDVRALLARPHVSHPALVPEVAHFGLVTPGRPVLQHPGTFTTIINEQNFISKAHKIFT